IPRCQRRSVLIDRGRRNPTPATSTVIVGATSSRVQRRIGPIESAAQYCAAHDEGVTAPRVIGADRSSASARRLESTAKIRKRKERDAVAVSLKSHLVIKRARGLAELSQQIALPSGVGRLSRIGVGFVCVRIKSAERTEKDLPVHAERILN